MIKAIKAFAYLNQHKDEVQPEDLTILENIYWQTRDRTERENIRKVIYKAIGSKEVARVSEIFHNSQKMFDEAMRAMEISFHKNTKNEKERKEAETLRKRTHELDRELEKILKEPINLLASCKNNAGKTIIDIYIHKIKSMSKTLSAKKNVSALRQFWGKDKY